MYSREAFFAAIKAVTGQQNTLVIPRELIHFLEDTNAALLLSQLIYWHDKGGKDGWVYKTYAEWNEELALSEYQVRRASNLLERKGLLETKLKKANGSPTLHYRLNWSGFSDSFLEFLQNRNLTNFSIETAVSQETLTKTTTETTTKTTSIKDMYVVPVLEHLNQVCGTTYRASTPKTQQLVMARIREGFTLDDFKIVINKKSAEWLKDVKMSKFLRPETLFGNKFESYLNEPTKGGCTNDNANRSSGNSSAKRSVQPTWSIEDKFFEGRS